MSSTMPPGYTTKYFGLVGGELGVMSKVDPLGPRPTSPELWRVATIPTGMGWSKTGTTAEADGGRADGASAATRAGGGLRSAQPNRNSPKTSLLDSRGSVRNRREELFTATKPPITEPVKAPEPPAWLESRSGLLREPSEGGCPSAASLASVGAGHRGSTPVLEWTSPGVQVSDYSSRSAKGGGGGGSVLSGGDYESSTFALSFASSPWAISDDEGSEGTQAGNLGPIKGAGERQYTRVAHVTAKPGGRKKARQRRRKRGKLQARSGGGGGSGGGEIAAAPAAAQPFSKTGVALPKGSLRERERDMTQLHPIDDDTNNGVTIRKPRPELYDVWIPQSFFQGRGLPTLKRAKGGVEPQPQLSSRSKATQAAAENKPEGDSPRAKKPNQGIADSPGRDRYQPASRRQQKKQVPMTDKRCAVHYVGGPEDFVKDDSAPPPPASMITGAKGDGTTSAHPVCGERPAVSFAGVTCDAKEREAEVDAQPWSVGDASKECDHDDDDRGGSFWSDDTRGGKSVLVGGSGESTTVYRQEHEGENDRQEKEHDDDDYFDYAKIFSWKTAAEVVEQAEAEAEAWSKEEQRRRQRGSGDESRDDGVPEDENHDEQLQGEARQQHLAVVASAATLRARERSNNAALVAVGRLRAPQSVFNPLHRTPSRPEMRRSITHGRFSPVGRKLWRQSEGLSPRTGQLCLSPRRRTLTGEGNGLGIGAGIIPPSGVKAVDVVEWDEFRPVLATHQQESWWGLTDGAVSTSRASADINDGVEGSGEIVDDVPPEEEYFREEEEYFREEEEEEEEEEEQRIEKDAGMDGKKTAGEGAFGLNPIVSGGGFAQHEAERRVHEKQGTRIGESAAATAPEDKGATYTARRGERDEGVPRGLDGGASDGSVGAARRDDGDVQGGWEITAPNGPERPPCSTATRSLSYTVNFPWDGLK
eukprot:g9506.t1